MLLQAAQAVAEQLLVPATFDAGQQQLRCPRRAAQLQLPSCLLSLQVGQHEGSTAAHARKCSKACHYAGTGADAVLRGWQQAVGAVLQQQLCNAVA